jgi:pyroglutamyl-peptidase
MACDVLVTGFGRYPGVRHNPTQILACKISQHLVRQAFHAKALVLPVSYGEGLALLSDEIARLQPRAILMLGLAARSHWFRVEMLARSGSSPLHADAAGKTPDVGKCMARPLRSTAEPAMALASLCAAGARTRLSASAGRYLCNASYALALQQTKAVPVLFIHIPPASQWQVGSATIERTLVQIGRQMLIQARRR